MKSSHFREAPQQRLAEGLVHVFSAEEIAASLRDEPEYRKTRHTGITLMKTSELRVVLEVAEPGAALDSHVVNGPATIFVIEGALEIETQEAEHRAGQGDMVVLPRNETRRIACSERSAFLLALSPAPISGEPGAVQ